MSTRVEDPVDSDLHGVSYLHGVAGRKGFNVDVGCHQRGSRNTSKVLVGVVEIYGFGSWNLIGQRSASNLICESGSSTP